LSDLLAAATAVPTTDNCSLITEFATLEEQGACAMHITSPFFVVPVIIVVFVASILFATSSKEDGSTH
jgi:hypothetical protein